MEPIDQLLIEFEEQERWRDLLGEVLAVLNRDGGHYQTKHGAGRAAIEGVRSHYQMLTTIDALQAENARLRAQAEALAAALESVRDVVVDADGRFLAAQKDVDSILQTMTEGDVHQIWKVADAALRAYREATQ